MDIRRLIQHDIAERKVKASHRNNCNTAAKDTSIRKWIECLNSIDDYVGHENQIDCLEVISTGWIDRFERFMLTADGGKQGCKPLSPATAAGKRAKLVSYCREAIKRHIIPNIPICPQTDDDGREIAELQNIDRLKDLESLLSLFHFKKETCEKGELSDEDLKALRQQTKALGYAVLSVLLCGIGYDGLCKIKCTDLCGKRLFLYHLAATVTLSDELIAIMEWLLPADNVRERLFFSDGNPVTEKSLRLFVQSTLANVALGFREGFAEPMTQWLEIALNTQLTPLTSIECRSIIDRLFDRDKVPSEQSDRAVQRAYEIVTRNLRHLGYAWYCLRCIDKPAVSTPAWQSGIGTWKKKDHRTKGELLLDLIKERRHIQPIDTFVPQDRTVKAGNNRKTVLADHFLSSLLFIKVNYTQLESVNRLLMSERCGFIYSDKENDRLRFAAIGNDEIDLLRIVFAQKQSRRLYVEADKKRLLGTKARIIAGLYDGFVGSICRVVVDKERNIIRVKLNFSVNNTLVEYDVDPDLLEKVDE